MKNVLMLAFLFFCLSTSLAQEFNGSMDFKYYTLKDTTLNTYYIKDKMVRLDNFVKKSNVIEGSYIFDLKDNKIKYIHPKRKVWGDHKSETKPIIKGVCEVTKGKNTRVICGIKCKDYVVKNTDENTVITYWIAEENFDFFIPLMKLWNGKYKQSVYFTQIKNLPEGSMPLLSEERQISDGKNISRLETTRINNKKPEASVMDVPAAYTKFE